MEVYDSEGGTHDTRNSAAFIQWIDTLHTQRAVSDLKIISNFFLEKELAVRPTSDVAIAASKVRSVLDKLTPHAPALGGSPVTQLPRDRWWKLFIEGRYHGSGNKHREMIFDLEQSPGFYNAMMKAFDKWLSARPSPADKVDFKRYHAMHAAVTNCVFKLNDKVSERATRRFIPVPHELSHYTNFPIAATGHDISWESLKEMNDDGDIGTYKTLMANLHAPKDVLEHWVERDWATSLLTSNMSNQLLWGTAYEQSEVKGKVNGLFERYHRERDQAQQQSAKKARVELKLRAIVRAIRALHVGHFYADANGRLNTMLLLNYLLLQEGFNPVILHDTAIFGGALRMYDLVTAVREGMEAFEQEVAESKKPQLSSLRGTQGARRCAICDRPALKALACGKCRGPAGYVCDGRLCQPELWALKPHEPRSVIPLMNCLCEACA